MSNCSCNLVGLLSINYHGIISASIDGSTTVELSDEGLVLLGATVNTLSISGYAFTPGSDYYLGVSCSSSAQVQIDWIQKYDCMNDKMHFIPKAGGKASIVGGPIDHVTLLCDSGIVTDSFNASAQNGPSSHFIVNERRDGFGLQYTGNPIAVNSASPHPYNISLGFVGTITAYLQTFSISVDPPQPAVANYSFVFSR